jgi:uncharacterized protein YjcR
MNWSDEAQPPRDELKQKYHNGLTTFELAERYDVDHVAVYSWLVRYDIERTKAAVQFNPAYDELE